MVVNLAVEDQDEAAICGHHRLMTGRRQVEDREPPMSQSDTRVGIGLGARAVGAAMRDALGHGQDDAVDGWGRRSHIPHDSAHQRVFLIF